MKTIILKLMLLIGLSVFAQNKTGSLLLLKIDKLKDLKVDRKSSLYLVLELDSNQLPLGKNPSTKRVFFQDFTDRHIFSCIEKDSIKMKTLLKTDTFEHDNNYGLKNAMTIENNSNKMNRLMEIDMKSSLYNEKLKISYTLINSNYCIGNLGSRDARMIGYNGEIVLVIDNLSIDNNYRISNEGMFNIIKCIDFNNVMF